MPKFSAYMKGSDGSQGPAGASIIDGILVNEDSLPQQAGHGKHAYLVGTSDPKNLWVWDEENSEWKDQGPIANRIGEVTASINAIPWTTTATPSVQTQFSTSNQIDSLNFDFTIPFLDNAYDVINNKVNRDGDTITGDLIIGQNGSLHIQQPGNTYTDSNFSVGRGGKTYVGNATHSSGFTRTGIIQENANGNKEYFRLPISYSTENDNTYNILTSKALVTVAQGGTGVSTATANYIFAAPAANNGSPSFRQLVANDIPNLDASKITAGTLNANRIPDLNASKITAGILPIERGGTGATAASAALSNLGAVAKSGDTMTGNLTLENGKMLLLGNSISTGLQMARIYLRSSDVSHGNNVSVWYNNTNSHGNQLYYLPAYDETLSSGNYYYKILTSKEPVAITEGGTGNANGTVSKLTTARTIQTNLASTSAASFDGSANVTPGVTGILGIANGGTGATTAANAIANLGAVSKSGDTMTGNLIVSDHNINVKKTNADISASTIAQNQYAIFGMTDKNDRYIGYVQANNDTSGASSITVASRKYINNSNVNNGVTLSVNASGVRSVNVNDDEAWRNAINAVNKSGDTVTGQLLIQQSVNYTSNTTQMNFAIGRTAKTYIVNNGYSAGNTFTAIVQEHPTGGAHEEFRLPISISTDSGTYNILTSKTPVTLEQGGTGGTDSGWQSYTNSSVFTGTIYYRKVGAFLMIMGQQINVANTINAGASVLLMTLTSPYRPTREIMPNCFINTSLVSNKVVPMRLTTGGVLYLYANKSDAIDSSYNLYFSGFGFM